MAFLLKLFKRNKGAKSKATFGNTEKQIAVPYLSRLEGNTLQPGQTLMVRGALIAGAEEFIINLTAGPRVELDEEGGTLDDRLLSIRVDVSAKKVFLNACVKGEWGKEGAVKHKWKKGGEFDIRVRCHEHAYDVFVSRSLVATFAHYVPPSRVSHLYINGDVVLKAVGWEGKYYDLPYVADVPDHLYPGRQLHLCVSFLAAAQGSSKKDDAPGFSIDFHADKNIALHCKVDLKKKRMIRQSSVDSTWSPEETALSHSFPFKRKGNAARLYDINVLCEEPHFTIFADGVQLCTFAHRISPQEIDRITISGGIVLYGIHLA